METQPPRTRFHFGLILLSGYAWPRMVDCITLASAAPLAQPWGRSIPVGFSQKEKIMLGNIMNALAQPQNQQMLGQVVGSLMGGSGGGSPASALLGGLEQVMGGKPGAA